jgi:hypothetical protein
MKKHLFLTFLVLLASCFSRPAMMNHEMFDDIQIGTPISDVSMKAGEPYAIYSKGGNIDEYEYIEKIEMNNELVMENHYFLIVSDGKVVGKRITQERRQAFDLLYQEDPNYPSYP